MKPAAAAQPGFSPDLLVGCLYEFVTGELDLSKAQRGDPAAIKAVSAFVHNHKHGQLKGYLPAACSRGLVSLRRPSPPADHGFVPPSEIVVCNPMTGQFHGFLPRPAIHDESHVLLPGTGNYFQLHVVNLELVPHAGVLQIQTFSSAAGNWGPVVATYARLPLGSPCRFLRPTPLVLNGAVAYWLCVSAPATDSASASDNNSNNNKPGYCHVLALPLDGSRQPGPIALPAQLLQRGGGFRPNREKLLLASTPGPRGDRLTLVSVKGLKMTMWALLDDDEEEEGQGQDSGRWTRLPGVDVGRSLARFHDMPELTREDTVALECFAERSRAVLFRLYHGTLFMVDMDTMEAFFVGIYSKQADTELCPYELNLDDTRRPAAQITA